MQVAPSDFCRIGTNRSVLWPSRYDKIRFRPGLCRTPLGELPRLPSRLGRGHPSPYFTPLGTDLPSALAMHPSRIPARSKSMVKRGLRPYAPLEKR